MHDDDLAIIELLCRCQLAARRLGCRIVVHDATNAVCEAVVALGLDNILLDPDGEHAARPGGQRRRQPTALCPVRPERLTDGGDD